MPSPSPNWRRLARWAFALLALIAWLGTWLAYSNAWTYQPRGTLFPRSQFRGNVGWGFSPDGKFFATSQDQSPWVVSLWGLGTGKKSIELSGMTAEVCHVCFSQDGRRCAAASIDGNVKVWDTTDGVEVAPVKVYTGRAVAFLALTPDGTRLASAVNGTMTVWDLKTGAPLFTPQRSGDSVAFSSDGRALAGEVTPQGTKIWDMATERDCCLLAGCDVFFQRDMILFPPRHQAISADVYGGRTIVWDWDSGAKRAIYPGSRFLGGHPAVSADGSKLLAPYSKNDSWREAARSWIGWRWAYQIFPIDYGILLIDLHKGCSLAYLPDCTTPSFLPDGHTMAACDAEGSIKLWDIPPQSTFRVFPLGWLAPTAVLLTGLWWHLRGRKKTAAAIG